MAVCVELKRYLSGEAVTFECDLVALDEKIGILKYVLDRQWKIQDLTLRPGTVTYAFYWMDRPYNLYWWLSETGETVGHYFNLADSVELSAEEFAWRDLIVDVLVLPTGRVQVIDEDEVPDSLDDGLKAYIEAGEREVLQEHRLVIEEAAEHLERALRSASAQG